MSDEKIECWKLLCAEINLTLIWNILKTALPEFSRHSAMSNKRLHS